MNATPAPTGAFKNMREASNRLSMVLIGAKICDARPLEWADQYSATKEPKTVLPKIDDHNTYVYELPMFYAQRLLSAEPQKYFYIGPFDVIRVQMISPTTKQVEWLPVPRRVPKLGPDGKCEIEEIGPNKYPKWIPYDEVTKV